MTLLLSVESLPSNTVIDTQVDAFQLPIEVSHLNYLLYILNECLLLRLFYDSQFVLKQSGEIIAHQPPANEGGSRLC